VHPDVFCESEENTERMAFALRRLALSSSSLKCRPAPSIFQSRFFRSTPKSRAGAVLFQHRNTPTNNADLPWEFTAENKKQVEIILKRYPSHYKVSAIMPLLQLAQNQNSNWLPISAMNKVAEIVDVAPIRV